MPLQIFNSLRLKKEVFTPLSEREVTLYTCGPTVYDFAHIGNLRTYVFEDILRRVLEWAGYGVKHVMNITDVGHLVSDGDTGEDKMEKGSRRDGKTAWDIARFYTEAFQNDAHALNLLTPNILCKATDHISEQIELIQALEKKGYTYRTSDGVYFDTSKFPAYGELAQMDAAGLQEGARVDVNPERKHPTDFALWKFSPAGEKRQMEWESPWGKGFPGWHIECSAMSMKYLGETIDIHCGGIDHRSVHHPNEVAQSEAATGKIFVRFWLHGEFLRIEDKRMGKSEGNFITLQTLHEKGYDPLAYKYFLFLTHYRKLANFTWQALDAATQALKRVYAFLEKTKGSSLEEVQPVKELVRRFEKAILDDLNMPEAVAVMQEAINMNQGEYGFLPRVKTLLEFDRILGLGFEKHLAPEKIVVPEAVQQLLNEREEARKTHNWGRSDKLRREIETLGYKVEDASTGAVVRKK